MSAGVSVEIAIMVATTDRSEQLACLCEDIAAAARHGEFGVTLGLVENSRSSESRDANRATAARLRARDVNVIVYGAFPGGASIGGARSMQRELLRDMIAEGMRPRLIWMLDDDLRLSRLCVNEGSLVHEPWVDPIGALLEVGRNSDAPDVLVGTVHGDPPIPAVATWASRMEDLVSNVAWMIAAGPEMPWCTDAVTVRRLAEPDYYYDYGGHGEASEAARWLPREQGQSAGRALRDMLVEALALPFGIGFTRPLIGASASASQTISVTGPARVRGGNAVFFDAAACLEHSYPVPEVAGFFVRRSDSIGLHLLQAAHGKSVVSSDFAVLHQRARDSGQRGDADEQLTHLVADTLGAALTRAVEGADAPLLDKFVRGRVQQIEHALGRLRAAVKCLRLLAQRAPRWVLDAGLVELFADSGPIAWLEANAPGLASATLPEPVRSRLLTNALGDELVTIAFELRRDAMAERSGS